MNKRVTWYGNGERLKQLAQKFTAKQLAKMFCVQEITVIKACKKLEIQIKTSRDEMLAKMNEALAKDKTLTAKKLAEMFDVTEGTVFKFSSNKEITLHRSTQYAQLDVAQVSAMCKTMSIRMIATELKAGYDTVKKFLEKNGLKANSQGYLEGLRRGDIPHWTRKPEHAGKRNIQPKQMTAGSIGQSIAGAKEIIWPENVKVQVIKPKKCNDWRNVMARKPLHKHKEITWRY